MVEPRFAKVPGGASISKISWIKEDDAVLTTRCAAEATIDLLIGIVTESVVKTLVIATFNVGSLPRTKFPTRAAVVPNSELKADGAVTAIVRVAEIK